MLPPDQSRVIKQAKFTYSPLRKALEKQINTIEDQGEKQIKAIQDNRNQPDHTNEYSFKDRLLHSKEREIFENIYNKILKKIDELSKKNNHNDLKLTV